MSGSDKYTLNSDQMKRLGVAFAKYVGAAAAVAAVAFVGQNYEHIDFGKWGAIAMPLIAASLGWATDLIHKWAPDNKDE